MTQQLKTELKDLLQARDDVVAAWEGGSIATGNLDQYSDLDLLIVLSQPAQEEIFALLDRHFGENYGVARRFRMPEPAWHGLSQCFYLLENMPPLFYCDIAVTTADNPKKLTEPDRHGKALVWFDKTGVYSADPTPPEELEKLGKRVFHIATDVDWLSLIELEKALARRNWIHAQMNYQMFVNRHLVLLLNLKYRPAKADFGIRYADREYLPEVAKKLEDLLRVSYLEDIEAKLPEAREWFEQLREELAERYS
jgi:predicted nucleotidyltransferase